MESTRVRPAQTADVPALAELMQDFYAEADFQLSTEAAARTFEQLLSDPRLGQVWLIECDGERAGFVVLTICYSMEYGGLRGFVDDFFVRARYRRRGLGAAALDAVRTACVARGIRALLVETGPDNAAALGVYRKSGFTDAGHVLLTLVLAPPAHSP